MGSCIWISFASRFFLDHIPLQLITINLQLHVLICGHTPFILLLNQFRYTILSYFVSCKHFRPCSCQQASYVCTSLFFLCSSGMRLGIKNALQLVLHVSKLSRLPCSFHTISEFQVGNVWDVNICFLWQRECYWVNKM